MKSTYDTILGIIQDDWITAEQINDILEDRGELPNKGILSRAYRKAIDHGLIERRKAPAGFRWQYEYRSKEPE